MHEARNLKSGVIDFSSPVHAHRCLHRIDITALCDHDSSFEINKQQRGSSEGRKSQIRSMYHQCCSIIEWGDEDRNGDGETGHYVESEMGKEKSRTGVERYMNVQYPFWDENEKL